MVRTVNQHGFRNFTHVQVRYRIHIGRFHFITLEPAEASTGKVAGLVFTKLLGRSGKRFARLQVLLQGIRKRHHSSGILRRRNRTEQNLRRTHAVFLTAQHARNMPSQLRLYRIRSILTVLQGIKSTFKGGVQLTALKVAKVTALCGRRILRMGFRQKFKAHAQVQRIDQGIGNFTHRIHDCRIGYDRQLDMAQQDAVELLRNGVLVFGKERIHFLFRRIDDTHMALAHAGHLDMSANLLGELVTVLRHANPQLRTNSLFKCRQSRILAGSKLRQVGVHALVHFGIRHHNRVSVDSTQQDLFFNQLVQHILTLIRFRHRVPFGSFLIAVQGIQEFRTHNRLTVHDGGNAFHQHRFSHRKRGHASKYKSNPFGKGLHYFSFSLNTFICEKIGRAFFHSFFRRESTVFWCSTQARVATSSTTSA